LSSTTVTVAIARGGARTFRSSLDSSSPSDERLTTPNEASNIVLDDVSTPGMTAVASSSELTTMATIQQDIESFHQFASKVIRRGERTVTIDDLYEQWRIDRFGEDDLKAIKASLNDLEAGQKGLPLEEFKKDFDRRRPRPTSA
jgi:hypothetical protein